MTSFTGLILICLTLFASAAFCLQDVIESRLEKIEGLITSLGKNLYSGEELLKM